MYFGPGFKGLSKYCIRDKKRFVTIIMLLTVFLVLLLITLFWAPWFSYSQYKIRDFDSWQLNMYFNVGWDSGVPWYILAAIDKAEGIGNHEISPGRSSQIAIYLHGIKKPDQVKSFISEYNNDKKFLRALKKEINKFKYLMDVYRDKVFPVPEGYNYDYSDGFGEARTYGGNRKHEGIDIMCDKGVPLLAVCDGVVERKGWLELGGWRLGIRGDDGIYYYYAHLCRYNDDLDEGDKVKKGQVIGYAGDSGYGEEGTTGQFAPHLHFGMYEGGQAVNPYPFLRVWERQRDSLKGMSQ